MKNSLKVMSYNIHFTIGTDNRPDWKRTANLIREQDPDIVGLQEVTIRHKFSPELDTVKALRTYLGWNVLFGKTIDLYDGKGEYGLAIASKHPIREVAKIYLPTPKDIEERIVFIVKVTGPERDFYCAVTHFSWDGEYMNDDEGRLKSIELITENVKNNGWYPMILTGDLNTFSGRPAIDYLHRQWDVANDAEPDTPTAELSHQRMKQIDFIASYPKEAFNLQSFTIIDDRLVSDHNPVCAIFE